MSCSVIIRAAESGDIAALADLLAERDRFYAAPRAEPSAAAIEDALFGPVPAGRALPALRDDAPAGLAAYSFLWPAVGVTRSLYLKELYVRAASRRHGIGRLLMRELGRIAAEYRCSRIEWTADADNPDAQRFYEPLATKIFYRA